MTKLLAVAGLASTLLFAGCAPAPMTKADVDGRIVCNDVQMDQVERQAKRTATQVIWVNCPVAVLRVT
jgi:hypothetical protein